MTTPLLDNGNFKQNHENSYHVTTHIHWACACECKQEVFGCSGRGHVIGAWRISEGYECPRHHSQTSQFLPVQTTKQTQSFQIKTEPAASPNFCVLATLKSLCVFKSKRSNVDVALEKQYQQRLDISLTITQRIINDWQLIVLAFGMSAAGEIHNICCLDESGLLTKSHVSLSCMSVYTHIYISGCGENLFAFVSSLFTLHVSLGSHEQNWIRSSSLYIRSGSFQMSSPRISRSGGRAVLKMSCNVPLGLWEEGSYLVACDANGTEEQCLTR